MEIEYNDRGNPNLVNAWFEEADLRYANLRNANLRNADLEGADLTGANFEGVKFPEGYGKLPTNKEG